MGDEVSRFWDANREKSRDPTYWMAHPLCRRAINRRVSGDPDEWPLDWFRRTRVARPFERGVSWGCGLGAFERNAVRIGIAREIDAFDISPASVEDARREAGAEGLRGLAYAVGDFNDPRLDRQPRYDVVFFHASLHHVGALERLFRRLALGLRGRAALYLDEYVGPSRAHWTDDRLSLAQSFLDRVPPGAKTGGRIPPPIEAGDPSEAIRSDEIPTFVREFFELAEWRPYGGQIADLVFPFLDADWVKTEEGNGFVAAMLAKEDEELARDPESTHYVVAYGRLKRLPGLARPLARQVVAALRRRLRSRRRPSAAA